MARKKATEPRARRARRTTVELTFPLGNLRVTVSGTREEIASLKYEARHNFVQFAATDGSLRSEITTAQQFFPAFSAPDAPALNPFNHPMSGGGVNPSSLGHGPVPASVYESFGGGAQRSGRRGGRVFADSDPDMPSPDLDDPETIAASLPPIDA